MNPQKFVVAVSGGVDSVVLLDMLHKRNNPKVQYIVAHFDHGIREDSLEDFEFVSKLSKDYGFPFEGGQGKLGKGSSEATAREARYNFLRKVKDKYKAEKIITAHHQDDLLETMILNIVRGTSPRGLAPMQHQPDLLRPLINKRKQELLIYAKENNLKWREDSTNNDESYLRNYIRANIMPKLEPVRKKLLDTNERIDRLYLDIDMRISGILYGKRTIYRPKFVYYPYSVQKEIVRAWLLKSGVKELDKQMIERITNAVKTLPIEKKMDVDKDFWLKSDKQNVYLTSKK